MDSSEKNKSENETCEEDAKMTEDKSINVHNYVNLALILVLLVSYILMVSFNALAGSGAGVPSVFYSTVGNISDQFQLFITPAGFTFSIWGLIFIWLALSIIYFILTIFISNSDGRVYLNPAIVTPSVTVTLSINFLLNLAWIFIWDRASQTPSLTAVSSVFLFLVAITNILAMTFLARNIAAHTQEFARGSPMFWHGLAYWMTLNGLGVYTTWTIIASLINLATALVYVGEVDMRAACLVSLSLLVIIHVSWVVVENFLVDFYARYLLTPYLVVIWASNGIRAEKAGDPNVPQDVNSFVVAIIVIACLTFLARIGLVVYKGIKKPLSGINLVFGGDDQE